MLFCSVMHFHSQKVGPSGEAREVFCPTEAIHLANSILSIIHFQTISSVTKTLKVSSSCRTPSMLRQYFLRPSCPFVGGGSLLLLALLALPSAFAWNSRTFGGLDPNSGSRRLYMLKKSESPQWEDLGWAWGKRSGGPNSAAPSPPNSANWDDLGWAWGKRSPAAEGGEAARRATAHREDPIVSMMANRVVRSMTKQSPDWHDLGWAWGRRK